MDNDVSPAFWLQVAGLVVVAVSAGVALLNYRRDIFNRRTDWLYLVFEKFYESDRYKHMRRILDSPGSLAALSLQAIVEARQDHDDHEHFIDYLNFFEFLCALVDRGRMDRHDLLSLFDYYIGNLAGYGFVTDYARAEGFEALAREFQRRSAAHAPRKAA